MEVRALVLRIVPYSDRIKIIQCLTENAGLQSYTISISGKNNSAAIAQTGKFIAFTPPVKVSKLPMIKDVRLDPTMNQIQISPQQLPVWFFALELLSKSAAEGLHIPGLRETIDRYYTLLCSDQIDTNPLIPVLGLSGTLGIEDLSSLGAPASIQIALSKLGHSIRVDENASTDELLRSILHRFQNHFSIHRLDSLELVS